MRVVVSVSDNAGHIRHYNTDTMRSSYGLAFARPRQIVADLVKVILRIIQLYASHAPQNSALFEDWEAIVKTDYG